jgi:hypothetical protein
VLLSCGAFEKDFGGALDSGHGGGETIRVIFEEKLVNSLVGWCCLTVSETVFESP